MLKETYLSDKIILDKAIEAKRDFEEIEDKKRRYGSMKRAHKVRKWTRKGSALPNHPTTHSVCPDYADSPGPSDPSVHPDPLPIVQFEFVI